MTTTAPPGAASEEPLLDREEPSSVSKATESPAESSREAQRTPAAADGVTPEAVACGEKPESSSFSGSSAEVTPPSATAGAARAPLGQHAPSNANSHSSSREDPGGSVSGSPASSDDPAAGGARTKKGMSRELLKLLSGSGNSFDELCFAFSHRSRHASSESPLLSSVSGRGRRREESRTGTSWPETNSREQGSVSDPSSSSDPVSAGSRAPGGRSASTSKKQEARGTRAPAKTASTSSAHSKTKTEKLSPSSPRASKGAARSEGEASPTGCVCDDAETAKAVAAALAAEMETCRELSSLLKNGKKGTDQGVVSEEILLALSGQKSRRPTRSCAAPAQPQAQAAPKGQRKGRTHVSADACGSDSNSMLARSSRALASPASLASPPSLVSPKHGTSPRARQKTGSAASARQAPETSAEAGGKRDEKAGGKRDRKADGKRDEKAQTDSRSVLEDTDEATQAAIAALLAEEIGSSKEAAKLLAGEGKVQAYERLVVSFAGGIGSRRRTTRQLATLSASTESASGKETRDNVPGEKRGKKGITAKGGDRGQGEDAQKCCAAPSASACGEAGGRTGDRGQHKDARGVEGEAEAGRRKQRGESDGVSRQRKAVAALPDSPSERREEEKAGSDGIVKEDAGSKRTALQREAETSEDEALCPQMGRRMKRDIVKAGRVEEDRKKRAAQESDEEDKWKVKEAKGQAKTGEKRGQQAKRRRKVQAREEEEGGKNEGEEGKSESAGRQERQRAEPELKKRERDFETNEGDEGPLRDDEKKLTETEERPQPVRATKSDEGEDKLSPAKRARKQIKSSEEEASTTAEEEQAVKQEMETNGTLLFDSPRPETAAAEDGLFSRNSEGDGVPHGEGEDAAVSASRHSETARDEQTTLEAESSAGCRTHGESRASETGRATNGGAEEAPRTGEDQAEEREEVVQSADEGEETSDRRRPSLPTSSDMDGRRCRGKPGRNPEGTGTTLEESDGQAGAREGRVTCGEARPLKIRKRVIKANAAVNFTLCGICGAFGDVLCCDFCPRVFHPACLFKYTPLRVFVPVELRAAANALSASAASSPSPAASSRATPAPDWASLPPPPPPLPGYQSHSRVREDERGRKAGGEKQRRSPAAGRDSEEDSSMLWMCPDCYGVPYSASRPVEHPAWRIKCLDWRRIAEDESSLFLSFPNLDAVQPYFGDEDAWRSFRDRKGQKLLKRSAQIAKTVVGAAGKGGGDRQIPAKTVFLRLADFPLTPARHLLHAMGKKTALQAVAFLKNLLLRVASSSKEEEQMNFLEFGAEVAYLLTNLLGYLGASRHLVDPIVDAASCILLLWSKRRRKLGKEAIMTDEALIFSTLEACWAQLVLHRYSTTSGLRAAPATPKTTLSCSLGEQKLYYREWKEEVERSIAASRLEFLYFDFRAGQLLYYDLSTCPNCDRSGGVSGRYAVCSLCNFHLPPEWACVDFGRLFEQLVWGSLMQRAGINPCEVKKGRSCWGGSSPVEQILLEMKSSLRPWRNRLDLGTEDWKNQVYMVAHALFVVSGWGRYRLDLRERFWLPDTRFLRFALHEAMLIGDVELTGEILHSLHLFVVSESPRRLNSASSAALSGPGDGAAARRPPRVLTEEEEEELQAEQFAIDLAIQHGIIYLLYRQSKSHRGCWTTKQDSFYKTFHTSFCAAIGLIRPHRGSSPKSSSCSSQTPVALPSSAQTVDRTHSEWQRLFCSSWPAASVSLASPTAVDFLGASRAAMLGPAVSRARRAADDASPVFPLSCGAPHSLRPRGKDDVAIRIATVKVFVRRPLRRMSSSLWRRLCASSLAACRNSKKSVKLFGEKGLLGPDVFGKSDEITVGVYSFQGICCVSLDDLSTLLLCEPAFLEHRVLAFIRTALVLPVVDAQQARPNRHVPPEFHRYFTAFENRNCLNGGEETARASVSASPESPSSSACAAADERRKEDDDLSPGSSGRLGSDGRGGSKARGTKKLFSLLDLKELLTLQAMMGIAEALVLPVEENIGALLRAVESQVFKPVDVQKG
ncbi:conserved hypothetical protein [Neospora caninum Liverpool]|uniref:Zinc finger PHD-type domain-containing protein n=1 Tax=Neospora caninum (strain Liverpool) TaxID=572307 RepID=F0VJ46_NEOCL|nr:conserved hypothetical protein [Neospora caninum Liverpool]CBZ53757.1 conserved hypothetical protein [Neospora caninum Liverpool]CEL67749.1 TPA: hypothetical protein BN1204_035380 [Neospora caninum Liverpool]|eukprot:XP_003883789.1 conserved hypothetical protein [Neospora caninum Liverpool]